MIKVIHFVTKMDRAGQETFIMNAFRKIDKQIIRFNFLCISHEEGDYDSEIKSLGGNIYYLEQRKNNSKFSKYIEDINIRTKWLLNNKDKYDIVHVHTYHAMDAWIHLEACRRAGVKKVIIHSHNTMAPHSTLHKLMRFVCRMYDYKKYACSREAGIWLHGKNAMNSNEISVLYNGIDIDNYVYDEKIAQKYKEEMSLSNKTIIGHIGRFNYQKNHEFLIDVFNEYLKMNTNAVLLLIGRGELENGIKSKVRKLGINESVRFLGVRDDVDKLMNCFDLLLFPSLFEGLSVVLVEAGTNGMPIIANTNTTSEAIVSDAFHLLPLGDKQLWANKINEVAGKRTNNIECDRFDIEDVAEKMLSDYIDLYEKK